MSGKTIKQGLAAMVFAATMLATIPLVLGLLGDVHPAFDSLGHFRAHLAFAVAVGGLLLVVMRRWKHGALAVALGAAAMWTTLPAFPVDRAAASAATADQAVYRLLQLNLRFDNEAPGQVLSLVGRTRPDVITFEEVSSEWEPRLSHISAMYPYSVVCRAPNRIGGVAILSRRPFVRGAPTRCADRGSLGIADVDFGGRALRVAALHLGWPWPFDQSRQLDTLRPHFATLGPTALLAGDLNAATWSAAVRRVETDAGLTHAGGIGPTWLDRRIPDAFRPYIGLPIDQVLSKGDIEMLSVRTLESVGSDHLPVLAEFSFTGGAGPGEDSERATVLLNPDKPGGASAIGGAATSPRPAS